VGVFFGSLLDADADDSALALCFPAWFPSLEWTTAQTSRRSLSVFVLAFPTYLVPACVGKGVALSGLRRPSIYFFSRAAGNGMWRPDLFMIVAKWKWG
jgi:hypothetical protein